MISFWRWLFVGSGAGPGIKGFLNIWLFFHIAVGFSSAFVVSGSLQQIGGNLILPLSGVFIGLAFAWGGNAQSLLQSAEIEHFSNFNAGGFEDYVYSFQLAILVLIVTITSWGVAGIGIFDDFWPKSSNIFYRYISSFLFFLISISIRECWHVVLASQMLLLIRYKVRKEQVIAKKDIKTSKDNIK
jgi:hypothetical protein